MSILGSNEPNGFHGACCQTDIAHTGSLPTVARKHSQILLIPLLSHFCSHVVCVNAEQEDFAGWWDVCARESHLKSIPLSHDSITTLSFCWSILSPFQFFTLFTELLICFSMFKGPLVSLLGCYHACLLARVLLSYWWDTKRCACNWYVRKQKQSTEAHLGIMLVCFLSEVCSFLLIVTIKIQVTLKYIFFAKRNWVLCGAMRIYIWCLQMTFVL